jgi:signal transduction histidine kinase
MVRNLLKRTQVRTALMFTLLFTVSVVLLFSALLFSLTEELEQGIKLRAERTRDALVTVDKRFGFDELVNVVTEEAESLRDSDSIFALLGTDGVVYAGNTRNVAPFDGWMILDRSALPDIRSEGSPQDKFHAIWTPVSKGRLLVGRSDREERQSSLILIRSLGWGLLATSLLAVGTGIYLARGTQRRIDDIADTLADVAAGQLDRRVRIRGGGDDIDEVTANLNAMLNQLQRLVENVNQVTTDIAHDLKKPMMRLRQRLEALRDRPDLSGDASARMDESLEAVDSIVATFDALLSIGQLQAGERRARFAPVDLSSLLADVADAYEPVIHDAGFTLDIDTPADAGHIQGDSQLLMQMMANLMDNSLRYCPAGTRITVQVSRSGKQTELLIADNGPGIPADAHEAVFRRFYRLERARSTPGHGLGLSVVSAIAELHGARIALSDNDPGTRIAITFPQGA